MKDPILVWRFEDAPPEYQQLSEHGGDEDWVVLVPAYLKDEWINWLDHTGISGGPSQHDLPDGRVIYIGAHA